MEFFLQYLHIFSISNLYYAFFTLFGVLLITLPVLGAVAYLTLAERKVLGWMHLRHGPMYVGPYGLGQPIADAVKLMFKENTVPSASSKVPYVLAPVLTLVPALVAWAVIPFDEGWVLADVNLGVIYLLAISSLGVYGILMAGWASNSKYPFLGAVRSGAQMVSYEVSMGLCLLSVILLVGSMNLSEIVLAQQNMWHMFTLLPMFIVFLVSIFAETNRAPFDLPEAEAELVAGYNVEYGSMPFAMFFLGEYANMILMSAFAATMFMGGWLPPFQWWVWDWIPGIVWFALKVGFLLFLFIWTRATFPRFRYDQLMRIGWKLFLPFTLSWFIGQAFVMKFMQVGWL